MYKIITAIFSVLVATMSASPATNLLDQGLGRFEIWMGIPHTSVDGLPEGTFQSNNVTKGEPLGLNADVKDIFTVIDEGGVPVLKITGEIYGGLTTIDSFENYHFSTEFKWGEKKWEPRLDQKRDSGILYHCEGPHGKFWNVWKSSLEYQVQESDLGDFIGLSGPKALIRVSADGEKYKYNRNSEETRLLSDYTFASSEPQKPHGEWNTLELYSIGQTSIHVVNGEVVMVLQDTQSRDGSPLTKGQIQIQSEAAECYYKEMQVTSIFEFPKDIISQIRVEDSHTVIDLLPDEYWWGGLSVDGHLMPFNQESSIERRLFGDNQGNQASPILVSSKGRYVWSEMPFTYSFEGGKLTLSDTLGEVFQGKAGNTLAEGFTEVSSRYFPSNGMIPDPFLFTAPQYNTWIELTYDQNEKDILTYADSIISNDYPAGVLMIDDNWQTNYGDWTFSAERFDNPKQMMAHLHADGFKVMMWVCPFVTADTKIFRYLAAEGLLHLDPARTQDILWANTQNKAAIIRWWNGASAMLDLSNPRSFAWFEEQLDHLVEEYDVDGFKFDAGDAGFYKEGIISFNETIPNDHSMHFGRLGLKYPLNEYRASWKQAGQPLAQRLRDKRHRWDDLRELIPGMIAQGLMGYAYTCPDMIGGGEYQSFINLENMDQEMVVRSAQVHALMPMMQFSVAPWRVLSPRNNAICRDMAKLHAVFGDEILEMAKRSSKTGEPIVKPMSWYWPENGYEAIHDQFILGDQLLVAPVVHKGARSRNVYIPEGTWQGDDGSTVVGPKEISIDVPLSRLPYYRKAK